MKKSIILIMILVYVGLFMLGLTVEAYKTPYVTDPTLESNTPEQDEVPVKTRAPQCAINMEFYINLANQQLTNKRSTLIGDAAMFNQYESYPVAVIQLATKLYDIDHPKK